MPPHRVKCIIFAPARGKGTVIRQELRGGDRTHHGNLSSSWKKKKEELPRGTNPTQEGGPKLLGYKGREKISWEKATPIPFLGSI